MMTKSALSLNNSLSLEIFCIHISCAENSKIVPTCIMSLARVILVHHHFFFFSSNVYSVHKLYLITTVSNDSGWQPFSFFSLNVSSVHYIVLNNYSAITLDDKTCFIKFMTMRTWRVTIILNEENTFQEASGMSPSNMHQAIYNVLVWQEHQDLSKENALVANGMCTLDTPWDADGVPQNDETYRHQYISVTLSQPFTLRESFRRQHIEIQNLSTQNKLK